MLKTCFTSLLLSLVIPLSACAQSCSDQYTQEQLDDMHRTTFNYEAFPIFTPNSDSVSYKSDCKYLSAEEEFALKTYAAFTFIKKEHYILYQCTEDNFVEIKALPKYLESHIEMVNGQCEPKFNPLGLRSYEIEFLKGDGEIIKLHRMVE